MEFAELESIYRRHLHLEHDPYILRLMYAIALANRFDGSPVWAMLIGPSGCGKSEILMSMSESDEMVAVSNLTPYSLASGSGDESDSLLFQLNRRILVVEDMSSIASMPKEPKQLLFSFLRSAYNGTFVRATGRGTITWSGKFGLIGGATLSIEQGRETESSLGERFIYVRMTPSATDERALLRAARNNSADRERLKEALCSASTRFFSEMEMDTRDRSLPNTIVQLIEDCAVSLSRARAGVTRDPYTREISFPVDRAELGTRIQSQLLLIALAAKAMDTHESFIEKMILRVVTDSVPYVRQRVYKAMMTGAFKTKEISFQVGMSTSFVQREIESMKHLGLVHVNGKKEYKIVDEVIEAGFRQQWEQPVDLA